VILAENVHGVAKVVDHISWVEPLSGILTDITSSDRPNNADAGNGNPGYTLTR
jgi:hypothetical protein